jgi:hypothetical protein
MDGGLILNANMSFIHPRLRGMALALIHITTAYHIVLRG